MNGGFYDVVKCPTCPCFETCHSPQDADKPAVSPEQAVLEKKLGNMLRKYKGIPAGH